MGFGRTMLSSEMRVPYPPAKITHFIAPFALDSLLSVGEAQVPVYELTQRDSFRGGGSRARPALAAT